MGEVLVLIVIVAVVGGALLWGRKQFAARAQLALADAKAEARRWTERLGGQVLNLDGAGDPAARQALADASERYNAAGSQLEQARTAAQCRLATQTAMEGLYYVRAARTAMGLDPGPELPDLTGQAGAGAVSEDRNVTVDGHDYTASPRPSAQTPNYYPGGMVAGRPVPQGWYSEPWWKTALVAGAWGVGSYLVFDALFSGMSGTPDMTAFDGGFGGGDWSDTGGDWGSGDWGGGDWSGGDWGGSGDFDF